MKIYKKSIAAISILWGIAASLHANALPVDKLNVGMAFLDILSNVVTFEATKKNHLEYQYERYKLVQSQRFPSGSHATVYDKPLCERNQGIHEFLNQECKVYQVLEAKDWCATEGKNCIAFRLADFVVKDKWLMTAIADAMVNVRTVVIDPDLIDKKYGVRDLQAPGLVLSPHAQWLALALDKNHSFQGQIKQHSNEIFTISFNR